MTRERDQGDRGVYPVAPLALLQWRAVVLYGLDNASQLPRHIIDLINQEREGIVIDSYTVKKAIDSLIALGTDPVEHTRTNLGLYSDHFLNPFLQATHQFYVNESTEFLSHNNIVDYVAKATVRLAQEETIAKVYLHNSSFQEHLDTCTNALVRSHVPTLQYEFGRLLEIGDEAHLKQIYDLLSKIPDGLDPIKDVFLRHIQEEGQAAIASLVCEGKDIDPSLYVNTIFTVHSRYLALVKGCFGSDLNFLAALGKVGNVLQAVLWNLTDEYVQACMTFVNRNKAAVQSSKSAELVARFTDVNLKRAVKAYNAMDAELVVNRTVGSATIKWRLALPCLRR